MLATVYVSSGFSSEGPYLTDSSSLPGAIASLWHPTILTTHPKAVSLETNSSTRILKTFDYTRTIKTCGTLFLHIRNAPRTTHATRPERSHVRCDCCENPHHYHTRYRLTKNTDLLEGNALSLSLAKCRAGLSIYSISISSFFLLFSSTLPSKFKRAVCPNCLWVELKMAEFSSWNLKRSLRPHLILLSTHELKVDRRPIPRQELGCSVRLKQ